MKKNSTRKDPLDFVTLPCQQEPGDEGFWLSLLSEEQLDDLLKPDPDWFQSLSTKTCHSQDTQHEDCLDCKPSVHPATKQEGCDTDQYQHPGPTPNTPHLMKYEAPQDPSVTPSLIDMTPDQPHGRITSHRSTDFFTPQGTSWDPICAKFSLSKALLPTPVAPSRLGVDLGMMRSLGVDPAFSRTSWTSSLATTPGSAKPAECFTSAKSECPSSPGSRLHGTAARTLFSPCPATLESDENLDINKLDLDSLSQETPCQEREGVGVSNAKRHTQASSQHIPQPANSQDNKNIPAMNLDTPVSILRSRKTSRRHSLPVGHVGDKHPVHNYHTPVSATNAAKQTSRNNFHGSCDILDDILDMPSMISSTKRRSAPRRAKLSASERAQLDPFQLSPLCGSQRKKRRLENLMDSQPKSERKTSQRSQETHSNERISPNTKRPIQTSQSAHEHSLESCSNSQKNETTLKSTVKNESHPQMILQTSSASMSDQQVTQGHRLQCYKSNTPSSSQHSNVVQSSPSHNVKDNTRNGSGTPSETNVEVKCSSPDNQNEIFSQISPGSLSAMCSAVDQSESSCGSSIKDEGQPNKLASMTEFPPMVGNTPSTKDHDGFTQLSPTLLEKVLLEDDDEQTCKEMKAASNGTDKMKNSPETISKLNQEDTPSNTSKSIKQPVSRFKSRQSKRFAYPSSSQINVTCPKKVFNFGTSDQRTVAPTPDVKPASPQKTIQSLEPTALESSSSSDVNVDEKQPLPRKPPWQRRSSGFTNLTTYNAKLSKDIRPAESSPYTNSTSYRSSPSVSTAYRANSTLVKYNVQNSLKTALLTSTSKSDHLNQQIARQQTSKNVAQNESRNVMAVTSELKTQQARTDENNVLPKLSSDSKPIDPGQQEANEFLEEFGDALLRDTQFTQAAPLDDVEEDLEENEMEEDILPMDCEEEITEPNTGEVEFSKDGTNHLVSCPGTKIESAECSSEKNDDLANVDHEQLFTDANTKDAQSSDNKENTINKVPNGVEGMPGFQSASGKTLTIKQDTMKKYQNLLDDDDDDEWTKQAKKIKDEQFETVKSDTSNVLHQFGGFKSASGNSMKVNTTSLDKFSKWLAEDEYEVKKAQIVNKERDTRPLTPEKRKKPEPKVEKDWSKVPKGFRPFKPPSVTAHKSNVSPLKEPKSETVHQNVEEHPEECNEETIQDKSLSLSQMNEISKVTADFMEHETSFSQFEFTQIQRDTIKDTPSLKVDSGSVEDHMMGGFRTATGKKVCVSSEAVLKAQKILQDVDVLEDSDSEVLGDDDASKKSVEKKTEPDVSSDTSFRFCGFQTASGGLISVSDSALKKAKDLLDDQDVVVQEDTKELKRVPDEDKEQKCVVSAQPSEGFVTARGNKISVSTEAMKKAQQIISSDLSEEVCKEESPISQPDQNQTEKINEYNMEHDIVAGTSQVVPRTKLNGMEYHNQSGVSNFNIGTSSAAVRSSLKDEENINHQCVNPPSVARFMGFQTAGGQTVHTSKESLKKARALLDDSSDACTTGPPIVQSSDQQYIGFQTSGNHMDGADLNDSKIPGPIGFQTASGHTVSVSSEALKKVKKAFEEENAQDFEKFHTATGKGISVSSDIEKNKRIQLDEDDAGSSIKAHTFQTARGKVVEDSDVSLKKDRSPLDEAPAEDKVKAMPSMGFQTASGRNVTVSSEAIRKAKMVLDDTSSTGEYLCTDSIQDKSTGIIGFQTAGGQNATVSKESVKRAKKFLEVDDIHEEQSSDTFPGKIGFQTAGGLDVKVSTDALKRARKLFEDDNNSKKMNNDAEPMEDSLHDIKKLKEKDQNTTAILNQLPKGFAGFQTAKGNTVNISEKALKEAKKLIAESECPKPDIKAMNVKESTGFAGFQTAKGRTVTVSEKALKEAQKLMTETTSPKDDENITRSIESSGFSGFQTAKGKTVNVSKNALKEAQKLMAETDSTITPENDRNISPGPKGFAGFQTAKGKSVNVSQKAFTESKKLMLETDSNNERTAGQFLTDNNKKPPLPKPHFNIFQTAKGNNVQISKDSLKDAKKLLNDDSDRATAFAPQISKPSSDSAVKQMSTGNPLDQANIAGFDPAEALESARALLADGDFDDDAWIPPKAWMKAKSIGPEELLQDRPESLRHGRARRLVTAPTEDVKSASSEQTIKQGLHQYSWTGPTTTKQFNAHHKARDDRQGFAPPKRTLKTFLQQQTISEGTTTDVSQQGNSTFNTPYKQKQRQSTNPNKSSSETPASTFKTPVKKPGSSFRTPVKSYEDPTQKQAEESEKPEEPEPKPETTATLKIEVSAEVQKARLKARVSQGQRIQQKKQINKERPVPGELYQRKTAGKQMSLAQAFSGHRPQSYSKQQLYALGVHHTTLQVSSITAEHFRFPAAEYYGLAAARAWEGVRCGDGALVVISDDGTLGREEICNALFDMAGVEPKLVCRDWVYNHYRWIVWKLAALEVAFPHAFGGRQLTPDNVMLQLKYRYDREVDHSHRSALKRIYEQDDTPQKPLILCVCGVTTSTEVSDDQAKSTKVKDTAACQIELTDGWYRIPALLDPPLSRLVSAGRLCVGDKLCTIGADFTGPHEACPPLQAPPSTLLRLSANSTRRARWGATLGYVGRPLPALALSSLCADGGTVASVDVIVNRVYPVQYLERLPGGGSVWRSERGEQKVAERSSREQQQKLEKLYTAVEEEVRREMGDSDSQGKASSRRYTDRELAGLQDGADLYDAMCAAADPSSVEMRLSGSQQGALCAYRQQRHDTLQGEIQAAISRQVSEARQGQGLQKRNVTSALKVRVAGCHTADVDSQCSVLLTVWRPPEDISSLLAEGQRLTIYNLAVGAPRGSSAGPVSLSTGRTTRYERTTADDNFSDLVYEPREVLSYAELTPSCRPRYDEFDAVGVVVRVSEVSSYDRQGGDEGRVQTVYLSDGQHRILAVKFWGALQGHYLDDLVQDAVFVALSNLSWRPDPRSVWPAAVATETTHVTTKPRDNGLQRALSQLQDRVKNVRMYVANMKLKMSDTFRSGTEPSVSRRQSLDPRHLSRMVAPSVADVRFSSPQVSSRTLPSMQQGAGLTPVYTRSRMSEQHEEEQQYDGSIATKYSAKMEEHGDLKSDPSENSTLENAEVVKEPSTNSDIRPSSPRTSAVDMQGVHSERSTVQDETDLLKTPGPVNTPGPMKAPGPVTTYGTAHTPGLVQTPAPLTSAHPPQTPEELTPAVARKLAVQRAKAARLEHYSMSGEVAPLYSPIPRAVRRAFKPPTPCGAQDSPSSVNVRNTGQSVSLACKKGPLRSGTLSAGLSSVRRRKTRSKLVDTTPVECPRELTDEQDTTETKVNELDCDAVNTEREDEKCNQQIVSNDQTSEQPQIKDPVKAELDTESALSHDADHSDGSQISQADSSQSSVGRKRRHSVTESGDNNSCQKRRKSLRLGKSK